MGPGGGGRPWPPSPARPHRPSLPRRTCRDTQRRGPPADKIAPNLAAGAHCPRPACRCESKNGQQRIDLRVDAVVRRVRRLVETLVVPAGLRVADETFFGRRGSWRSRVPQPAVTQNLLDHLALRRLDKGDRPSSGRHTWAGQRVNLVDPLDEHGPGLAATALRDGADAAGQSHFRRTKRDCPRGRQLAQPPCGACRGPCSSTSRNSGSGARPWAEYAA